MTGNVAAQSLPTSLQSVGNPLMSKLTSSLGVTQDQAEGGVGSILTLAQEKLAKGDFDKVAALIPGASATWKSPRASVRWPGR
jgi:hypothetical protein